MHGAEDWAAFARVPLLTQQDATAKMLRKLIKLARATLKAQDHYFHVRYQAYVEAIESGRSWLPGKDDEYFEWQEKEDKLRTYLGKLDKPLAPNNYKMAVELDAT